MHAIAMHQLLLPSVSPDASGSCLTDLWTPHLGVSEESVWVEDEADVSIERESLLGVAESELDEEPRSMAESCQSLRLGVGNAKLDDHR